MIVDQAMKQQQQVFPGELSHIPGHMMALSRPPNPLAGNSRLQGPHQVQREDTRVQQMPEDFSIPPLIGSVPVRPPRTRPSSIPGIQSQGPRNRNPVIHRVPVLPSASAPQSYGPVNLQARTQPLPRTGAEMVARSNHPTIVPIGASGAPAGVTLSPEDLQEIGFFLSDLPSGGQPGGQDTPAPSPPSPPGPPSAPWRAPPAGPPSLPASPPPQYPWPQPPASGDPPLPSSPPPPASSPRPPPQE